MSEEQVAEVSAPEMDSGVAQSVNDWRNSIPEDIRGHKSLSHINDVGALAKSYVHAQSMIGADKIAIPGKHSSPEDWHEVYNRLGRPESAEAYELPAPEGFQADEQMTSWFKGLAHELGLNSNQAATLYQEYNNFVAQSEAANTIDIEGYQQQVQNELQREFGQAYDDRIQQGFGVVSNFGNPEMLEVQMADGTRLGDNPDFIRLMGTVGAYIQERVGEDSLEGVRTSGGISPDEAQSRLNEIRAEGSPFWDRNHAQHQEYVDKGLYYQQLIHDIG